MAKNRGKTNVFLPVKHTNFESSAFVNDATYIQIYNRMKELCLNLFNYENLPVGCEERYLEQMLYECGFCFFFLDDALERYCNLGGTLNGVYDIYGNPTDYMAISFNGNYRVNLNSENSVIIWNNYTRTPTRQYIEMFAWRAYSCLRTADVNLSQQKTCKMLKVPEKRRLTVENLLMKVQGNEIYALMADDMDIESMVMDLTVPYIADKAMMQYNNVWNDFLTFIGVVNHNTDKRERENVIEVMGHMGSTEMERNTMMKSRKIAVEKINDMFGLDVEVEFNSNLADFVNSNRIETGLENVNLYNDNSKNSGELRGDNRDYSAENN